MNSIWFIPLGIFDYNGLFVRMIKVVHSCLEEKTLEGFFDVLKNCQLVGRRYDDRVWR